VPDPILVLNWSEELNRLVPIPQKMPLHVMPEAGASGEGHDLWRRTGPVCIQEGQQMHGITPGGIGSRPSFDYALGGVSGKFMRRRRAWYRGSERR
jgi:hypothetical protein